MAMQGKRNTATGNTAWLNDIITDGYRPGNQNLTTNGTGINLVSYLQSNGLNSGGTGIKLNANALNNAMGELASYLPTDPLVLDLNGDGVRLTDYGTAPVLFDIDNDGGSKEQTGWASAQDGIVVYDINTNGKIDNMSETLSEYFNGAVGAGKLYPDGFAALKTLDSNKDNQFTSADTTWNTVKVWVDDNHDGKSWKDTNNNDVIDTGEQTELKSLASLNITSINLNQTIQSGLVRDGNEVLSSSTFVQNGQTKEALAANFIANPNGSTFTTNGTGTLTTTQGNIKSYTAGDAGETINVTTKAINNAQGGAGNDTLMGDAANDEEWRKAA